MAHWLFYFHHLHSQLHYHILMFFYFLCFSSFIFLLFLPSLLSLPYPSLSSPSSWTFATTSQWCFCLQHSGLVLLKCTLHTLAKAIALTLEADQLLYCSKRFLHQVKVKCQLFNPLAPCPPLMEQSHFLCSPFTQVICHTQHGASHLLTSLRPSLLAKMTFSKLGPVVFSHSHITDELYLHSSTHLFTHSFFFCSVVMDRMLNYGGTNFTSTSGWILSFNMWGFGVEWKQEGVYFDLE